MPVESRLARVRRELWALIVLALPIVIAQLAHTAMGFADTVMAGQVSPNDLAGVALGNSVWVPAYLLMIGILMATTPCVAQRFGANRQHEIGSVVRQALWLGFALGVFFAVLLWNARPLLDFLKIEPELADLTMGYLQGVAYGFPFMGIYQVLRYFSDGIGRTRPSMVIGLLGLSLNVPLNYVLIHGLFGLPQLGGVGCGWATGIVNIFMCLGMVYWAHRGSAYKPSRWLERFEWPSWASLKTLLVIGVPIGISIFAEASIFSVIALLIGELGAIVVSGHQITLNFTSMIFMIPLSLGMATTVRVSQALGAGRPRDARFIAGLSIGASVAYACCSATFLLLMRYQIAGMYSPNPEVIQLAAHLFLYAAIFQFSDVIQVSAAGSLRGYQDTRMPMLYTVFAYWGIGLPVGYILGLTDWVFPASGPSGLWQGLIAGLSVSACLLTVRLARSARREIRHPRLSLVNEQHAAHS